MTNSGEVAAPPEKQRIEAFSLAASKWANLFMGVCGIVAAWASNSNAILLDGLFSGIGFVSAVLATKIGNSVALPPDRIRPFGYEADESLYTTFRSLSLFGLILFALGSAILNIVSYVTGNAVPPLLFGPLVIYFAIICVTCGGLAVMHHVNWQKTGRVSDILKLERNAAVVDGTITAGAALGLLAIPLLAGTPLAGVIPIGDSVVLLLLCALIIADPVRNIRQGIAELAGASAQPEVLRKAYRIGKKFATEHRLRLIDVSVIKLGRIHTIAVYIDPEQGLTGGQADKFTNDMEEKFRAAIGLNRVYLVVSSRGRR